MEEIILVDEHDVPYGTMEKMEAHRRGLLHRAFSIFVFNSNGELLLQRRALSKYHSPGLWTNTCCSHPRPGESIETAANRRLKEEMGIECHLEIKESFIYRAVFPNNLIEHEYDHVLAGISDELPVLNPDEVMDYRYCSINDLNTDVALHPELYSIWLNEILKKSFLFLV